MTFNDILNKIIPFRKKLMDKAFFDACSNGKLMQVYKFLGKGVDLNVQRNGVPAIIQAISMGHSDIAMFLAKNPEVDINKTGVAGKTPLYAAVVKGDVPVVKSILAREDLDLSDKGNASSLHQAVFDGNDAMVHFLGGNEKIDVNVRDELGKTPLHYASKMKNSDIFRFLAFHPKADVNIQDKEGKTPLYEASEKGKKEYVHYLLLHPNIKPNIQDREGNTPLHIATLLGNEDIVQILGLNSKVDLSVKNNIGRTAEEATPFYETRKNFLLINRLRKAPNESFPKKTFVCSKYLEKKQSSRE
jgi:ankyrin repeat protein